MTSPHDRAVELMRRHAGTACGNQSEAGPPWKPVPAKPKRSIGGPITDKQKRFIETTAQYNGKSLAEAEAISQELYGCPIAELTTKDVNPILDKLKM